MKTTHSLIVAAMLSLSAVSFNVSAQSAPIKSEDQIKAEYKAAKEKCDAMSGKQEDACEAQAKATRETDEANAKVARKDAEARNDVAGDKRDADYKAAKAQCDTLSGDAEKKCELDAKTKFNK